MVSSVPRNVRHGAARAIIARLKAARCSLPHTIKISAGAGPYCLDLFRRVRGDEHHYEAVEVADGDFDPPRLPVAAHWQCPPRPSAPSRKRVLSPPEREG